MEKSKLKNKKILMAAWGCENPNYASYQCWYDPLKKLFKEVNLFDPQKNISFYGRDEMKKRLFKEIETKKPDYVFFWLIVDEFDIDFFINLRKKFPKLISINLFGDDDLNYNNYSAFYKDFFDYCLIVQPKFKKFYASEKRDAFVVFPVNSLIYKPLNLNKTFDVTFVGTHKFDRYETIKFLKDNGVNVRVFGAGWEKCNDLADINGGPLDFEKMIEIFNSTKVNLCFTKNYLNQPHIKSRFFEISACKTFSLHEYYEEYKNYFKENKEIVMYKNKEELLSKIRYYLRNDNEREEIAKSSYKKVINNYVLDVSLNKILNTKLKFSRVNRYSKENVLATDKLVKEFELNEIFVNDKEYFMNSLLNFEYVSFKDKLTENIYYKNLVQIEAIIKSGKPIASSDYYIKSKSLGKFLKFDNFTAFEKLGRKTYADQFISNQILIKKDYFLNNFDKFVLLFKGKDNSILTINNTIFVIMPLVETRKKIKIKYDYLKKLAYWPLFKDEMIASIYQKKFFSTSYNYKLLINSVYNKKYILFWLLKERFNKGYFRKILNVLNKNSLYDKANLK